MTGDDAAAGRGRGTTQEVDVEEDHEISYPSNARVSAREKTMSVGGGDKDDDGVSEEPDSPSAFFLFMDDFRKDYEEKHPADAKQVYEIGMAGDEAWKSMSDDVSAREKTMSVGGGDKDDDGVSEEPDSPPSAFFLFMDDFRKDYEEKHPADAKQVYEIGMAGDEAWKSMSDDAKAHYVSKVEELKEEYMSNRNAYLGVADGHHQ
uniref:HMG box domain-containing protein n=1 Tax=Oryza punctata TaxID=4537 RepID=A0A0E0LQB4_ORYPU